MGINVLSLFDGMSCGMLALNKAGIEVDNYFASEIDSHAIKSQKLLYPSTIQIGDVKNIHKNLTPKIDLLIGGSPCQGFSFAGKREGMVTACKEEITTLERYLELKAAGFEFSGQSYLFWEYVRILEEAEPTFFFLENVRMKKESAAIITNILGTEPIGINSNLVSAQNRERLYWTNIPGITQPKDQNILLEDILEGGPAECVISQRGHGNNPGGIKALNGKTPCLTASAWEQNNKLRVRRKSKCVRVGGRRSKDRHEWDSVYKDSHDRKLSARECGRLQTVPEWALDILSDNIGKTAQYKLFGNGWTVDVIAHCFSFLPIYMAKKCKCIA